MPAVRLRFRVRALLSERGRAREFWVETRINFRKRMDDRLSPVMMNDSNPADLAGSVLINKQTNFLIDSCRPSAQRGERQMENPPAHKIVRTVMRRTPTFYCREHTTGIRFSRISRKYFGNKNLRPSGNQFRDLLRFLIKKPCLLGRVYVEYSLGRI